MRRKQKKSNYWNLLGFYLLLLSAFTSLANTTLAGDLISHNFSEATAVDLPERFDNEAYGHTKPTVSSQKANYQLKELFGIGTGRQFSGFAFPDTTSNWDAESMHMLYEEAMKNQLLDEPIITEDLPSPFNSFIGN
ncbi:MULTISPECIES: hypothetical protein [Prochlorococcus]|uniref:hypothetical protein n=1 Tax=Prochlorococcus TaxID=1218 RepID=UPI000533915C|nr:MULTISPECIES: hypothetical protein [Prochlorococcus]KGG12528.1 hypothetical protein EV05_1740 [Prochlorococcus sp. MIT 0601]